mgnify:FL=1
MNYNKEHVLNTIQSTFSEFIDTVNGLNKLDMNQYTSENTMVVMIDMINGFCKLGPLHSDYVNQMIPKMSQFLDTVIKKNIPVVSYRDSHPDDAGEFDYFPIHCVEDSEESSLVDELQRPELIDITKNSTNGFLAQNPLELSLINAKQLKHILVMGCVTDICIRDFSTTMAKYLQEINHCANVTVIENLVDTFDIENVHDRQTEHLLALYHMKSSGVQLARI